MTDYSMIFVLLALGVFFSVMTNKPQDRTGAGAGRWLAARIGDLSPQPRVVILASDPEFVNTLRQELTRREITVVRSVAGDPAEIRAALEELAASSERVDILACLAPQTRLPFVRDRSGKLAPLAPARILVPDPVSWPDFLRASNIRAITNRVAVIAIIAIGMTCVIITGGIDLSAGSLVALSAVVAAYLIEAAGKQDASAAAMILSSLAAIGLCGAIGTFSGLMITKFQVPAFIVTLSMMQVARGLAFVLSNSQAIYQLPDSFQWFGRAFVVGLPSAVALMLALYIVAHIMMSRTTLGRYIYAVGGNPEAARLSGVPIQRVLLFCYTLCGALAGLGGVITASQLKSGEPNYGEGDELDAIAAVVVGGTSLAGGEGRILGTLIGALIIAVIRNGLNLTNVESNSQRVVLGLVILAAVLFDRLKSKSWRLSRRATGKAAR